MRLNAAGNVTVTLTAAAYLPVKPNEAIRGLPYDQKPYWDVERARIGDTRDVPVEIVVNGKAAGRQTIAADGNTARAEVRSTGEGEQLDRRAGAAFGPHQPCVRDGGRQARARVAG